MNTITASFSLPSFEGKAPAAIVFFPKGSNTAMASRAGKPFEVTVNATMELAGILNAQLQEARNNASAGTASRPFIDFGHKKDAASAIPTEIYWDEDLGVMCSVEWTKSGKEAIEGKDFSYFSPEFLPDGKDAAILRIPGPIGGLVNTPAFQTIGPIAASLTTNTTMDSYLANEILSVLLALGVVTQEQVEQKAADVAVAKIRKMVAESAEVETAKAQLAAATAQLATFQQAEADMQKVQLQSFAELAVSAAFADGKITDKAPFIAAYLKDPETVKAQLAALPAKKDGHAAPVATITAKLGLRQAGAVMPRGEFGKLPHNERNQFIREGGKLSD